MERAELHRRINLIQEKIKEGGIQFASHLVDGFWESFKHVRILPDGMVDPDSVDGRIRSMCLLITYENDSKEWQEAVSLREIQEGYFQRVNYAFGQLYEMMIRAKTEPYKFSGWFSSNDNRVKECLPIIDEFYKEINEFWANVSEPTWIHLEGSFDSKAVFTGELFPEGSSNVASSTGLYFDTTILPDPFLKISPMVQFMVDEEKCYEIVRLALQVLSYKSLALAETEKPIIAILPDRHQLEDDYREFVNDCAVSDSIEHTRTLFGQEIGDRDELFAYFSHFKDADEIVSCLINPDKLIFATEWDGSLPQQMMRLLEEQGEKLGIKTAGQAVFMHIISRFAQANDAFQRSLQLRGTPIIRAETSWIWYNQMLEYNAGNSEPGKLNDLHISRALDSIVRNKMPWMGNIPPDALIEIRKSGALDEIRELLSGGLNSLIESNPSDFYRTGEKVFESLDSAFKNHEKKIKELMEKRWKFAGRDIGSFVVVGGIEITAALTGLPMFGVFGAVAGMTGMVPNVRDLKERFKKLKAEESEIKNTGVGVLLKNKSI
ncbi:hypothetical protein [Pectobacterium aroidearum]|uniref:hypothetical protein n=1 Tax=Pectobacterium aroidearum TaxID=1201031 RepID=UPI003306C094